MKKTIGKIVLVVVIAGLLTGGFAIASAATKIWTVTTPRGTSVDVISVTGIVTEVLTAGTTENSRGIMGMFRRGPAGYAKIKQADNTIVTVILGHDASSITVKVGDAVKIEGFRMPMDEDVIMATSFMGADGKTVPLNGSGFGGCGVRGGRGDGQGADRGFRGGMMGGWSGSNAAPTTSTGL